MPTIEPGTRDQQRSPRWPVRLLVGSLIVCAGYGIYILLATLTPWPLPEESAQNAMLTALLLGVGATAVAVLCLFQRERHSRRVSTPILAELAHLTDEVEANRSRLNELAERTVPIIYMNPSPQTPATLDAQSTMSREDYWKVYSDVLVDLAAVGGGGDSEGGVHPSVHP